MLLRCHKQFEGVVTKMGKSGLMKGGDEQMVKQMQRNPNQVLQQLHKTMDPVDVAADGRGPEPHEHDEADERVRGEGGKWAER